MVNPKIFFVEKVKEMACKAFESGIFSLPSNNFEQTKQSNQSEKTKQSERSNDFYSYISPESIKSEILNRSQRELDDALFTPEKITKKNQNINT